MWTRQRKKRNTGRLIVPAVAALFLSYFGYHAVHGEYGLNARYGYEDRARELSAQLETLRSERERLEARNLLLHNGSIERDMLDEQARRALDYVRADEIVIMRPRAGSMN
ncbi:MAG: septum formation initiator family protein [Rhizobiaceae bacterium]|nr:septum formation initiator family protein [Rhizobiaceae bacterium]MCV0406443.1 septum formation initiator family protein [Rhizobiaceae bacterium]